MNKGIVLSLPWPDPVLSPNSPHRHWRAKHSAKVGAREAGYLLARNARDALSIAPLVGSLSLSLTFHPPRNRRRDLDNLYSSLKSAIDGVCYALGIDDSQIKTVSLTWGEVERGGAVVAHISEVSKVAKVGSAKLP